MTIRRRALAAMLAATVVAAAGGAPTEAGGPTGEPSAVVGQRFAPRMSQIESAPPRQTWRANVTEARRRFEERAAAAHRRAMRTHERGLSAGLVAPAIASTDALTPAADDTASGVSAEADVFPALGMAATVYDGWDRSDWMAPRPAVSSSMLLATGEDYLKVMPLEDVAATPAFAWLPEFLGLPDTEAMWGATPAWDQRHGRWVLAASVWEIDPDACDEGWLVLAVSTGADPLGTWTRWRIPIGANTASDLSLGLSDELIAIGGNEYPLDGRWQGCVGLPFSGARLRVLDWADVLDGGTVEVADLTPPRPRRSWSYRVATNVPATGGEDAGSDLRLVVDRYDATALRWGNVVVGRVTGGVQAGTIALALDDLTAAGTVPRLVGPPWLGATMDWNEPTTYAAIDEAAQSVARRGDRFVFTAATTCTRPGDPVLRACVRAITLDGSSPPALVEETMLAGRWGDTPFGSVGFTRDGTLVALYDDAGEVAMTWRSDGETLGGVERASTRVPWQSFGSTGDYPARGAVLADPVNPARAWSTMPTHRGSLLLAVQGGLAGAPSGTIGAVPAFTREWLRLDLHPDPSSPITSVRTVAVRQSDGRVVGETTGPSSRAFRAGTGAASGDGPRTVTIEWLTADGVASAPVTVETTVDETGPGLRHTAAFAVPQTLGSRVRTRWNLLADDFGGSGVGRITVWDNTDDIARDVPPAAPWVDINDLVGVEHRLSATAWDVLDNQGEDDARAFLQSRLVQSSGTVVSVTGSWKKAAADKASGGSVRTSKAAGAKLTLPASGIAFALVVTKGPGRGQLAVSIDGGPETIVDTYRSTVAYRQVVWQASAYRGAHSIRVRVVGTPGRPRVDVDAFLVLEDHWSD